MKFDVSREVIEQARKQRFEAREELFKLKATG
jgi:hypothetical protein